MEQGPFRMPRPAGGSANKPEPAHRPKEEPQPVKEEPKPVHREAVSHRATKPAKEKKSLKSIKQPVVALAVVAVLGVAGWFAWSSVQGAGTAIDSSKYQAVFFTNGQVYFGKLHEYNNDYMKLSDIYYLQTQSGAQTDSKNPQKTASDQGNVQLVKLGDEIHGPEDEMVVSKAQMLFYENLKPKGKVAESIASYNKTH